MLDVSSIRNFSRVFRLSLLTLAYLHVLHVLHVIHEHGINKFPVILHMRNECQSSTGGCFQRRYSRRVIDRVFSKEGSARKISMLTAENPISETK